MTNTAHTPTPRKTCKGAMTVETDEFAYITFPHFWMYRSNGLWRWVNTAGTRSSPAGFDFAPQCALDAEHKLKEAA